MKKHRHLLTLVVCVLLGSLRGASWLSNVQAAPLEAIQQPVLKWQRGGCTSWCQTGWYSSPAVADLDGDGTMEVIAAAYTVFVINGEDGSLQWSVDPPGGRVWPGVVVADLDADSQLEIITAHGSGYVHAFSHTGSFYWSQQPTDRELRGLSVYDLDADGTLEVIVTGAVNQKTNTWIFEHNGTLRPGWPQLDNDSGYAYGVFNDNAAIGDLDKDGQGEIVVPSDVHYICAYEPDGTQIPANAMYGGDMWGKVGVWESLAVELRGWGQCDGDRAESYRTNFAHGASVISDVNSDGTNEVVATGNVYDCSVGHPPGKYNGVYVYNADRSRFNKGGYDWQILPVDTGAPLSEDYSVIEHNQPNPVVADLDGDGELEIVYSSYDGKVHAFWLDKTEHAHWPYAVYNAGEGFYRFASEPVIVDLDNNGTAEVIFASWTQKGSGQTGRLHILDRDGTKLYEVDLPAPDGSNTWNGALAAPTVANIDADADLEIVLNTAHSGVVAYDLPGTANARVLWGTGRGSYWRNGSVESGGVTMSKRVSPGRAETGDTLTYTIDATGAGKSITLTDDFPSGTTYIPGSAACSPHIGTLQVDTAGLSWTGVLTRDVTLRVTFDVIVTSLGSQAIVNTALLNDGEQVIDRSALTIANGYSLNLPLLMRN